MARLWDYLARELPFAQWVRASQPAARAVQGQRVALYATSSANEPGREQCHVTNTGTKIQDTLAWANARLAEESFGEGRQDGRLANQPLMFGIGIAQRVMRGATARWHMAENITMWESASA